MKRLDFLRWVFVLLIFMCIVFDFFVWHEPVSMSQAQEIRSGMTTRDLFEVEWNKERHGFVGMYRGHHIYTDSFRVWWESRSRDDNGEDVYTWTESTEVVGVYLGNRAEVYVLLDEDEDEHTAYCICLCCNVDRLDVLDEQGNRIVSLR
jgi:hypothetical protein